MKKTMIAAALAAGLGSVAQAQDNDVSLQLQWVTQSQFAGYYVAHDQGVL